MPSGSFIGNTHIGLEVANCSFNTGSFIENITSFQGSLLDTGNHTEVIGSIKSMGFCF